MGSTSRPEETAALLRGLRRRLTSDGCACLAEFVPTRGLRVDLCAITSGGSPELWVFEIKSSIEDFRADRKWRGYQAYCDRFAFCVGAAFPTDALPVDVGLWRADAYDAAEIRSAAAHPLAPARRRALVLKLARDAARRLTASEDPGPDGTL